MDKQSPGKKLQQAADVQRILRRPINPARFRSSRYAGCFKPTRISLRSVSPRFAFSFQICAMLQDNLVDALSQGGEQFTIANVHRAADRVITACGTDLVGNSNIDSEVSHPI